jgi:cytochrome c peroxidase
MLKRMWPMVVLTAMGLGYATGAAAYEFLQPLPDKVPIPKDNPQSGAKIALGKQLYFDRRLSVTGTVSCNSCHNVMAGGQDNRALSVGALGKSGRRNAPTVWNVAFQSVYYWDGRARSLEEQLHSHLLDDTVMAMADAHAVQFRLERIPGYRKEFVKVFGGRDSATLDNTAKALASYIRTLVTPGSAFDHYIRGNKSALSASAKRGLNDFREIGCMACHFGPNFSGPAPGPYLKMGDGFYELFPNFVGSKYDKEYNLTADIGRYEFSHDPGEKRMFRLPVLRNIAVTGPYFHNGSVPTLSEAVRVMARTQDKTTLTVEQTRDIVAFLESLTGHFPAQTMPKLPPTPHELVWPWQQSKSPGMDVAMHGGNDAAARP